MKNIICTMGGVRGYLLGPPHSTTPAAILASKNKTDIIYITDRSKAVLLLWFYLFYVLESILCCLNLMYICIFSFIISSGN